jgi:hypothetical protein
MPMMLIKDIIWEFLVFTDGKIDMTKAQRTLPYVASGFN